MIVLALKAMKVILSIILIINVTAMSFYFSTAVAEDANQEIILISEVEWEPLNPARGDKSPKAATLWGDRKGNIPTGFLVKFVDGFSSPPHIHNVSYRGIVIDGQIHNDDPQAEKLWMPNSSFWTQPAGEIHITAAKGSNNLAYIEIDQGPYLVFPEKDEFEIREKPVNVHASNIVWINTPGIHAPINRVNLSYLWGEPQGDQLYGVLIKLPAGLSRKIQSYGSIFRAVVIDGKPQYQTNKNDIRHMDAGSYFSSNESSIHQLESQKNEASIIYVRTNGKLEIINE